MSGADPVGSDGGLNGGEDRCIRPDRVLDDSGLIRVLRAGKCLGAALQPYMLILI